MNVGLTVMSGLLSDLEKVSEVVALSYLDSLEALGVIASSCSSRILSDLQIGVGFVQKIVDLFIIDFEVARPEENFSFSFVLFNVFVDVVDGLEQDAAVLLRADHGVRFA